MVCSKEIGQQANGTVPPQFRECVASLTGARFPSSIRQDTHTHTHTHTHTASHGALRGLPWTQVLGFPLE